MPQVGDRVGVGCMVDSCRSCSACKADSEQFCSGPATFTYNSAEPGDDSGAVTKVTIFFRFTPVVAADPT